MTSRCLYILLLLVNVSLGIASAQHLKLVDNPCAPELNFFPTGAEIGSGASYYELTVQGTYVEAACTGDTLCNFPAVFSNASQQAAAATVGGISIAEGGLLRVALRKYGEGVTPQVYFKPKSILLEQNADATDCVEPATNRKLLAAHIVNSPGQIQVEIEIGNNGFVAANPVGSGSSYLLKIPTEIDDGCATIRTTISNYVATNMDAIPLNSTRKVCWYRNNGQANATLDIQSVCLDDQNTGLFATVSNFNPSSQNFTQNDALIPRGNSGPVLLFQDVIQVWKQNFTALRPDDIELTMDLNEAATNYFFVPSNASPGEEFSFSVSRSQNAELQEGYYHLRAKASVFTYYPEIVDLQGKTTIEQTDVAEVQGYTEYMGKNIEFGGDDVDSIVVGVQKRSTVPQLCQIDAEASPTVQEGDQIRLTWQFYGVADRLECFHDNVQEVACKSPMNISAASFVNATEHTFTVTMTDVCGNQKNASYVYTTAGIKEMTQVDYTPAVMYQLPSTPTNLNSSKANTASTAGRVLATVVSALTMIGMATMV